MSGAISTGTERYSREVITALLRIAPQHRFWLYVREPLLQVPAEWQDERIQIIHIEQPRLWTHIGLAREIMRKPPDALFIPSHVLPVSQAIWHATRTVVTVHDVGYRHFPGAHPWRQRLYLDWSTAFTVYFASGIVTDSDATRRDVLRFYDLRRAQVTVAYPGLVPLVDATDEDVQAVRAKFGLSNDSVYVLYIGTLQPRKNLMRLIQAWRLLLNEVDALGKSSPSPTSTPTPTSTAADSAPPLLIIAGAKGWGDEDLQHAAASLGLADSVRFTGYVSDVEKSVLLRGARAFAYPSLYEGFGLPVLEAQSVGVPVLCSDTSSLPEVVEDSALQVTPTDVSRIAWGLWQVMYDNNVRSSLIMTGHQNVSRFSWERCASTILQVLEETGK